MEISYWQSRWRKDKTGWHMQQVFPLLKTYWNTLPIAANATVLVPLCGKSLDLKWLRQQGHYVIGVDVSPKAIETLMQLSDDPFNHSTKGPFDCYKSTSMELWCGDFMKLEKQWLPPVQGAYDKAALIALPPEMRKTYARHLQSLLQPEAPIFLNCFEYEQDEMPGPPFSVSVNELETLFGTNFSINTLHSHSLFEELTNFQRRGLRSYLREKIYHLSPKQQL